MTPDRTKPILVSSCLLGLDTRYNGISKKNDAVIDFLTAGQWVIIPCCPEQLAGLPTPRPATEFVEGNGAGVLAGTGQVINDRQEPMNALFIKGAEQTLKIAELNHCRLAILKERSPSCGVHEIYCNNRIVPGSGVTAALLQRHDVAVYSENDLDKIGEIG